MAMCEELCYNFNIKRFYKFRICVLEIDNNRILVLQLYIEVISYNQFNKECKTEEADSFKLRME